MKNNTTAAADTAVLDAPVAVKAETKSKNNRKATSTEKNALDSLEKTPEPVAAPVAEKKKGKGVATAKKATAAPAPAADAATEKPAAKGKGKGAKIIPMVAEPVAEKQEEKEELTPVGKTEFRGLSIVAKNDQGYRMDPRNIIVDEKTNPRTDYGTDEEWAQHVGSIRKFGVRQAIQVYARKDKEGSIQVHLAQGFRRMRAVLQIIAESPNALQQVPVEWVDGNKEAMLIEHVTLNGGKPLRDIEMVDIIAKLKNWGYSPERIAEELSLKETKVAYLLNFGKAASEKLKNAVLLNKVGMTAAVQLVKRHKDTEVQNKKLQTVLEKLAEAEAGGEKAPRRVKATDMGVGKVNLEKGINELLSAVAKEQEQFPETINLAMVDSFKLISTMLKEGKSANEIIRQAFVVID